MVNRKSENIESLWDVRDVVAYTKIPKSTIMFYIATNQIPSLKIGKHRRFIPGQIRDWVENKAS